MKATARSTQAEARGGYKWLSVLFVELISATIETVGYVGTKRLQRMHTAFKEEH